MRSGALRYRTSGGWLTEHHVFRTVGGKRKPASLTKTSWTPIHGAFFTQGQASCLQRAMAASSRSTARRSGFWGSSLIQRGACRRDCGGRAPPGGTRSTRRFAGSSRARSGRRPPSLPRARVTLTVPVGPRSVGAARRRSCCAFGEPGGRIKAPPVWSPGDIALPMWKLMAFVELEQFEKRTLRVYRRDGTVPIFRLFFTFRSNSPRITA